MTKFPSCNGERSWWLLRNDKCLRSATARTLWKKGESSAPSVFHAFLGAICERALNLYVCRGGALWLAYHRTQTQSATQWECLFNPSTDIDSYYWYDTRTRQKCFIRTGYSFQPSIRLNSSERSLYYHKTDVRWCEAAFREWKREDAVQQSLTLFSNNWFNLIFCVDLFTRLTYMLYSINVCRNFPHYKLESCGNNTHKFRPWLNRTPLYRYLWNKIPWLLPNFSRPGNCCFKIS